VTVVIPIVETNCWVMTPIIVHT